jgi:hypothetical protein
MLVILWFDAASTILKRGMREALQEERMRAGNAEKSSLDVLYFF